MSIWFIADTHFRHKNILEFENRPFETLEEMEKEMIKAWNSVVKKNDVVYVVGDFCFDNHNGWIDILEKLKGNVILIKGNHDKTKVIKKVLSEGYLQEIHNVGTLIQRDKMFFNLTHYPLVIGERPFMFNISGHIHSRNNDIINQLNVGVDSDLMQCYYLSNDLPFGTPVSFDYLAEYAEKVNEKMKEKYVRGS